MVTNKVGSRLVRNQKKQLMRQTAWSIIIGTILIIAFIFVVLPNTVKLLGMVLDTTLTEEKDEIPPQVPILTQPESDTNQALLSIKGFAEPESKVITVLNGDTLEAVDTNQDGVFEIDLPLTDGENSFIMYSKDKAENTSRDTKSYTIVLDTEAPTIALNDLANGQEFIGKANQQINIQGVTEPNSRVYINQRLVLARSDGSFSLQVRLNEGENPLEFKVVDKAGNEAEIVYSVSFKL